MNKRLLIVFLVLIFLVPLLFFLSQKPKEDKVIPPTPSQQPLSERNTQDEALKNALNLYAKERQRGTDFSNGPCLGSIAQDWVLDIAHNPRLPVDDQPQNQCPQFKNGEAHHFIELDPEGMLIQIY